MLALVSGKKKNKNSKQNADRNISSQIGQVHGAEIVLFVPPNSTAHPPMTGRKVGPLTAAMPQIDIA